MASLATGFRRRNRRTDAPGGPPRPPAPHASGARAPSLPVEAVPRHVAIVMDGNGRWAKARGLPRTDGHKRGEFSLFDTIEGALELGIPYLSAYAFSTENWTRSPEEVRFLMGFSRNVLRNRRDQLIDLGVRVVWSGRRGRLWKSVISELETAEEASRHNSKLVLQFCVNYGGQAEIADAAAAIARDAVAGRIKPDRINEKLFARYLYQPDIPPVDLFLRPSGEQRLSNFLLWQSSYAELVTMNLLWPDFDRRHLWQAVEQFTSRNRRFGGTAEQPSPAAAPAD
jgi:undecaprenyl diphosphate synthase